MKNKVYRVWSIVDKDIKDRIAALIEITGHSESKQTKLLLKRALDTEEKLTKLSTKNSK